jgi:aryl-alcohol dehydrogenase-like predicted oxidoreductase
VSEWRRNLRFEETALMDYVQLGRTGLKVSRLCLGTMNFGPETSEPDSYAIMDRALEHGINFFDTANVYGRKKGEGVTEQIVGRWWAQGGKRRERVVLATKVYGTMGDWPNESRLSALNIRRACDDSLKRLQTDYIDLYQMHHIDRHTPWEEIWQAMETLVQQGKILYVGSSNFAGWHIAQANEAARTRHFMGLVSEQSLYNLRDRMIELEVIPACQHYGLALIPWSPLAGGLLGGVLEKQAQGRRAGEEMQKRIEKHRAQIERYEEFCRAMGEKPADVGIAWLMHQPSVTAPIVGPRTMDQLEDNMHALTLRLSAEHLKTLDEIFPGPGGAAPEAYAW